MMKGIAEEPCVLVEIMIFCFYKMRGDFGMTSIERFFATIERKPFISPSHEALQEDVQPENVKALFDETNKIY